MQVPGRRPTFARRVSARQAGVWLTGNSRPVRLKIEQPWKCKSPHADQFGMSTGRAGRTCLLNSGLPERGVWCESTAFRHSCARSSKRAGGLIPRIALDQCRDPERYRTRTSFVPVAQITEQLRPKHQVAGESPAGDTNFAGVVQQQNAAVPRPRQRCDSVHPLHFYWERSSPAEVLAHGHHLTCERQRGQHVGGRPQGPPTIFARA